jgi:hypothetical protein
VMLSPQSMNNAASQVNPKVFARVFLFLTAILLRLC